MLESYKELVVFQKSYQVCLDVYELTKKLPKEEIYGLVSQMRRAAVSVPSNIAEGYRRKNRREYVQFLRIALGSCAELETQTSISRDLKYISEATGERMLEKLDEINRLLFKLIGSLEK